MLSADELHMSIYCKYHLSICYNNTTGVSASISLLLLICYNSNIKFSYLDSSAFNSYTMSISPLVN